ncbi:hypothetical protein [Aeromonas phage AerS_266]|nr:hypothetical protein [Aeromonas phage AerS_266]
MESVFEDLTPVGKARLINAVAVSAKSLWATTNKDFKRFNLSNGSSALVKTEKTINGNMSLEVVISNPKCKAVETAQVIFEITAIGKKTLYEEKAELLAERVGELFL